MPAESSTVNGTTKWPRSFTGLALIDALEEGPYEERIPYDPSQRHLGSDEDLSIEEVGAATANPWETDGQQWHTQNRVDRDGEVCQWDGEMLTAIVAAIEKTGKYGETHWNHQTIVEIPFENKARGWFMHAVTSDKYSLILRFRVKPRTFLPGDLIPALGLQAFEEMDQLPDGYVHPRIRLRRARGPSQEVEIRLFSMEELQSKGFAKFLAKAIQTGFGLGAPGEANRPTIDTSLMSAAQLAAYQAAERRREAAAAEEAAREAVKKGSDDHFYTEEEIAVDVNIHGDDHQVYLAEAIPRGTKQWHVSRCGFKEPEKVQWPTEVAREFVDLIEELFEDVEFDFQRERQIQIRLPRQRKPWMTVETKERPSLRINWNLPNDVIDPDRLAELEADGKLQTSGPVDRITLHLTSVEQVQQTTLRSLLEHGFENGRD